MNEDWHLLFEGELTDAPGRCESWTEHVEYLGDGKWRLCIEGTSFDGTKAEQPNIEEFTTARLVNWVKERSLEDEEDGEGRIEALVGIAKKVGCGECLKLLEKDGKPKSAKRGKGNVPKVTKVIGKGQRTIWLHKTVPAIEVETDQGLGTLVEINGKNVWHLKLKSQTGLNDGFEVELEKPVLDQIKSL